MLGKMQEATEYLCGIKLLLFVVYRDHLLNFKF